MGVDGFRFDLAAALARSMHDVDMLSPVPRGDRPGPGAAPGQADRRAVGRRLRRLPGGRLPAAVDGVERPLPRRRTGLLARRAARRTRPRLPAVRLQRPVRLGRPAARTPRSTSSPRTTVSPCATWCRYERKHNEANGEGNRDGTDDNRVLELRRRGRDRRPARQRAAPPAAAQPADHPAAVDRACRCWSRATRWAAPRAATTTPTARTTRSAGSTGRCWSDPGWRALYRADRPADRAAPRATRCCAAAASSPGRAQAAGRAAGPGLVHARAGAEMTERDWYAPDAALGMYLSGRDIPGRDARGAPVTDDSFLALLHAGPAPAALPPARAAVGRRLRTGRWTPRGRTRTRPPGARYAGAARRSRCRSGRCCCCALCTGRRTVRPRKPSERCQWSDRSLGQLMAVTTGRPPGAQDGREPDRRRHRSDHALAAAAVALCAARCGRGCSRRPWSRSSPPAWALVIPLVLKWMVDGPVADRDPGGVWLGGAAGCCCSGSPRRCCSGCGAGWWRGRWPASRRRCGPISTGICSGCRWPSTTAGPRASCCRAARPT